MSEIREVLNFINGRYRPSDDTYLLRSPIHGGAVANVHVACQADVDAAVRAAREALNGPWGRMGASERHAILRRATELIQARSQAFITAEIADSGHPWSSVSRIEIPRGAQQLATFADVATSAEDPAPVYTPLPGGGQATNTFQRMPKGVIAAICPWNLPLIMATWKLAPALAWANCVVLKPSEFTPSTAAMLGEIFNDAGMPPGVVNIVQGSGANSTGAQLVAHPGIDAINFTGETATGAAIMQAAAVGVRDVSLELGGKNAALVLEDCDMDAAVAGTAAAAFYNCGQICLGTERVYVARSRFDEFVERLTEKARAHVVGDPQDPETTLGPLVSHEHQRKVLACYARAVEEGAEVLTGGGVPDLPGALAGGAWIEPTIWTGLPEHSETVREEIFGPCCHLRAVDSDEEAVALANDTRYGLAAAVWSENPRRAQAVAAQLRVGVCWINGWMIRDLRTPFGGVGQSGIGREGGAHAMEFHTELKTICKS
ncbi:MAG: aldehyde dehydrogenase family protein [Xanthomonadales bacterium]|nr:aldehyde dehydrogenase family protein [Xanthomonadales bacterium]